MVYIQSMNIFTRVLHDAYYFPFDGPIGRPSGRRVVPSQPPPQPKPVDTSSLEFKLGAFVLTALLLGGFVWFVWFMCEVGNGNIRL